MFKIDVLPSSTRIGSWHIEFKIYSNISGYSYNPIFIKGMITGCGLMQLYGFTYFASIVKDDTILKDFLNTFKTVKEKVKDNGVGAILATLGQDHYKSYNFSFLEHMGFKEINEYSNYRHSKSGSIKQKLYICTL